MNAFTGNHTNKLDDKGRVSIPSPFRPLLGRPETGLKLVLRPALLHPCLEGCSEAHFQTLTARLDAMDPFSAEYEDQATELHAQTVTLDVDGDGRTVLPSALVKLYGFQGSVTFLGIGRTFQIWDPPGAEQRMAEAAANNLARQRARAGVIAAAPLAGGAP